MISILILTKNEERDLPGCLASVAWSDDVHVFDSLSTDATAEIAKAAGATVATRPFDGYASQRNAGLALPFSFLGCLRETTRRPLDVGVLSDDILQHDQSVVSGLLGRFE